MRDNEGPIRRGKFLQMVRFMDEEDDQLLSLTTCRTFVGDTFKAMAGDKKKKRHTSKKAPGSPTKVPRLAGNKKLKDAFLIKIALKLLLDVAKAAKEVRDPPPPK